VGIQQRGSTIEARQAVRRAIELDCAVYADTWDEALVHHATNVSELGLWLESDLLLDVGTEVSVVFTLPDWLEPLYAAGRIQRVLLRRRHDDPRSAGMGVAFEGLRSDERRRLSRSLAACSKAQTRSPHEQTLVGIPVAPGGCELEGRLSKTRTVMGWAAPAPALEAQPRLQRQRSVRRDAKRNASASSAFGGGLSLVASAFRPSSALDD
jgi:hypothetical protein